jgi:NAD(P)-dependent dehydrogenase (short-subunit alcohol dehydrogenase family)
MNDSLFDVSQQVVLVSGGTRGIGRALAEGFAQRGATVVVTGREAVVAETAAKEIAATTQGKCLGLGCDVARSDRLQPLVDRIVQECGRIDTLLNVAGVNRRKRSETVTEEDFDFIMDTNFKGAFLLSQTVGKHMLERGKGNQINVVSLNNFAPLPWVLPYAASKAAMGHMTRTLAAEWGPRGIRVNAIAPGFILTDLSKKLWSDPTMQAWNTANTPLKRLGDPKDLVGAAIFLASEASAFMTGQIVFVDGGFSAGICWPIEQAK